MIAKQLLAHRGFWTLGARPHLKKNSRFALEQALIAGFGLEIDIRDHMGEIVVSHDVPGREAYPLPIDLLAQFVAPIAFNVKSDGLTTAFPDFFSEFSEGNNFFFDMSFPEKRRYDEKGLPSAVRISEFERPAGFSSSWYWLDAWESEWYLKDEAAILVELLSSGANVAIVSPELHGRDEKEAWQHIAPILRDFTNAYLCTDFPDVFFKIYGGELKL
jgi:glycerophosphoryl diester phosphodiesterase